MHATGTATEFISCTLTTTLYFVDTLHLENSSIRGNFL